MGAQMNIKSDEAYAIASELAAREQTSLTQVVLEALRARKLALSQNERLERAMAIARDMRARLGPDFFETDHDALLYDENGLPR